MKKATTISWVVLILFTIISAILSGVETSYMAIMVLGLAVLKFIGVAFEFMELKKAHWVWQLSLLSFLAIFTAIVLAMM